MYPTGCAMIKCWWTSCGLPIPGAKMASMTASVGEQLGLQAGSRTVKDQLYESITRLCAWLERNDHQGYDTFDGLNAKLLRPLTFNNKVLRTVLQQGVRRFPINLRPLLGIAK